MLSGGAVKTLPIPDFLHGTNRENRVWLSDQVPLSWREHITRGEWRGASKKYRIQTQHTSLWVWVHGSVTIRLGVDYFAVIFNVVKGVGKLSAKILIRMLLVWNKGVGTPECCSGKSRLKGNILVDTSLQVQHVTSFARCHYSNLFPVCTVEQSCVEQFSEISDWSP